MAKKNARNKRGKIVSAAWKLFYEQGYEDTTVEELQILYALSLRVGYSGNSGAL